MTDEMEIFNTLRNDFNQRSQTDPDFRSKVSEFNRVIQFTVMDTGNVYNFEIKNGEALPITTGAAQRPNITLSASIKHLMGILTGQIHPAAAIMNPNIKILGSPSDLALIKKFILKESAALRDLAKKLNV